MQLPLTDIRAALIDMDGTLYDSMPRHASAWKQLAHELGIEATRSEFFLYEGMTGAATINILFRRAFGRDATDEEARRHYARKTELFRAMPGVEPMPGAAQLLAFLRSRGIQRVLVTGSGQNSLISRLDSDFPGAFASDMRITAHNTRRGKPYPDPYLAAMQLAGAEPRQCVAFENAPLGVESAVRSGAFTVAIATGPIPKQALKEAGAHVVYDSMPQCAEQFPALLASI